MAFQVKSKMGAWPWHLQSIYGYFGADIMQVSSVERKEPLTEEGIKNVILSLRPVLVIGGCHKEQQHMGDRF